MSCPDWNSLTAHRRNPDSEEPRGWKDALSHLDGCAGCRREAIASDPTLLFHRLSGTEPQVERADEAAAMRRAVASMRHSRELERFDRSDRAQENKGSGRRWGRWVAAAAMVMAALPLGLRGGFEFPETSGRGETSTAMKGAIAADASVSRPGIQDGELESPVTPGMMPFIDGLDLPQARLYQMASDGLAVVMIVDENLDV